MVRKRVGFLQRDRIMGHLAVCDSVYHSLFQTYLKRLCDGDSLRSPTSPLDSRVFSNSGDPYCRSPIKGHPRTWDGDKVGLSIIDSLDGDEDDHGEVLRSPEKKNVLFGSQVRFKTLRFRPNTTNSLLDQGRKPCVIFEMGETCVDPREKGGCSFNLHESPPVLDSKPGPVHGAMANSDGVLVTNLDDPTGNGLPPAGEMELSEDYTCVTSHGPNPTRTHIYGDCVMKCEPKGPSLQAKKQAKLFPKQDSTASSMASSSFFPGDFLSSCCYCSNKLEAGKDIYIYRGEKSFCSPFCRSMEIMIDEESDNLMAHNLFDKFPDTNKHHIFEPGLCLAR